MPKTDNQQRKPTELDAFIGAQIRKRRVMLGMSQKELAAAISVSYQQLQKYERCGNRIAASRLADIAEALDAPLAYFYGQQKADFEGEEIGRRALLVAGLVEAMPMAEQERVLGICKSLKSLDAT